MRIADLGSYDETPYLHMEKKNSENEQDHLILANRYSGVVYGGRFLVTKIGFLRSPKRVLVIRGLAGVAVVDPYDTNENILNDFAFDAIKEILLSSSDPSQFTFVLAKNQKETFAAHPPSAKGRIQFLSAYYQMRERAALASSIVNTLTTSAGGGDAHRNLFHLTGKTFQMYKYSSTVSSENRKSQRSGGGGKEEDFGELQYQEETKLVTLAIRAASLDRLEEEEVHSSIPLMEIEQILKIEKDPSSLLIYYTRNRIHRYFFVESSQREPFIQTVNNNLRSWLGLSLTVKEVEDCHEFNAMTLATREIIPQVQFEMPVFKLAKKKKGTAKKTSDIGTELQQQPKLVLFAFTGSTFLERDPETKRTLASFHISDLFNLVIYPTTTTANDATKEDDVEFETTKTVFHQENSRKSVEIIKQWMMGDPSIELSGFALELKIGRTRRYFCKSTCVADRNENSTTMQLCSLSESYQSLSSLIQSEQIHDGIEDTEVTGYLTALDSRSLLLSNLFEMARMNNLILNWSTSETGIGCKEGSWMTDTSMEWEDILLRKVSNLPTSQLDKKEHLQTIVKVLIEFNQNVFFGTLKNSGRDRKSFAVLIKITEQLMTVDDKLQKWTLWVNLFQAQSRCLSSRGVFEDQVKNNGVCDFIIRASHHPEETVALSACLLLKNMLVNWSDRKNLRGEQTNRRLVFSTPNNIPIFLARLFQPHPHLILQSNQIEQGYEEHIRLAILNANQTCGDYLVRSSILETLESLLSSGKKTTPERLCSVFYSSMLIQKDYFRFLLLEFNRSLSFAMLKNSCLVLKMHILEQKAEIVESLQDFARSHGILIWHLYLALASQDRSQRRISSQLVALLTHENPVSSAVIRRCFPNALIADIPTHLLAFDEYGRLVVGGGALLDFKQHNKRDKRRKRKNQNGSNNTSNRSLLSSSQQQQNQQQQDSIEFSETEEDESDEIEENEKQNEIRDDDVEEKLRRKEEGSKKRNKKKKKQDQIKDKIKKSNQLTNRYEIMCATKCVVLLPEFFDRITKTHVDKDLIWRKSHQVELISKLKKELQVLQIERLKHHYYLLRDPMKHHKTFISSLNQQKILKNSRNNSISPKKPGFSPVVSEEETMPNNIWLLFRQEIDLRRQQKKKRNSTNRKRKKKQYHPMELIDLLTKYGVGLNCVCNYFLPWNAEEFEMLYICEQEEVRVGAYYLRNLINDYGVMTHILPDPKSFLNLLYFRLLSDTDDNGIKLLVLHVMTQLYEQHVEQLSSICFINHLVRISTNWILTIRGNIMVFLEKVLTNATNTHFFIEDGFRNLIIVLELIQETLAIYDEEIEQEVDMIVVEHDYYLYSEEEVEDGDDGDDVISSSSSEIEEDELKNQEDIAHPKGILCAGALSSKGILLTCLGMLINLVECHSRPHVEEQKTPVATVIKRLCEEETLCLLVTLLNTRNQLLFLQALKLLRLLVKNNYRIIPSLHKTGIFSSLLRFADSKFQMRCAAHLFAKIHLRQQMEDVIDTKEQSTENEDELTAICGRSYLRYFLPLNLICQLVRHGPAEFAAAILTANRNDPEVIWNNDYRAFLQKKLKTLVSSSSSSSTSSSLIIYPDAVYSLTVAQYYLSNLLRFPSWPIQDEGVFLAALLNSLSKDEKLVLQVIKLMYERFPNNQSSVFTEEKTCSTLLNVLDSALLEQKDEQLVEISLAVVSTLILYSSDNAKHCSTAAGVRVLCKSLQLVVGSANQEFQKMDKSIDAVLKALHKVLIEPRGRIAAAAQSIDIIPFLLRFLQPESTSNVFTLYAVEIVEAMCLSRGDMGEVLLQQLAEYGVIWYLILLCLNCGNDGQKEIAQNSAKALCFLVQCEVNEESIAVKMTQVSHMIRQVLTTELTGVLEENIEEFLSLLTDEEGIEQPTLMWTKGMRKEMVELCRKAICFHETSNKDDQEEEVEKKMFVLKEGEPFYYVAEKEELRISGVYLRFYNAKPWLFTEIMEWNQPQVMRDCLSCLSHQIAGLRQQPSVLKGILNQILVPVTFALRNFLQYTKNRAVVLQKNDGVQTFFSLVELLLEHEDDNVLKCQEICVEVLLICVWSAELVDTVAQIAPNYASVLFSFLNHLSPSTSSSKRRQNIGHLALQLLGNLCLIPTCIDSLVSGMDPNQLSRLLPFFSLNPPVHALDFRLVLSMYLIPLKRHTSATSAFAKAAIKCELVQALLNVLSSLLAFPPSHATESSQVKLQCARLLGVLAANPGSGNIVHGILSQSAIWSAYSDISTQVYGAEDLTKLLEIPYAPAIIANQQIIQLQQS